MTFQTVSPVIPVRDLDAALARYRKLGFTVTAYGRGTGYGFADRDTVSLHMVEWDEHDPQRTASTVYIYVSDADAVRTEWIDSGAEGRFSEALDRDYGLREFAYVDPDGTLHRVGSRIT